MRRPLPVVTREAVRLGACAWLHVSACVLLLPKHAFLILLAGTVVLAVYVVCMQMIVSSLQHQHHCVTLSRWRRACQIAAFINAVLRLVPRYGSSCSC
jgi:hypothetical protein